MPSALCTLLLCVFFLSHARAEGDADAEARTRYERAIELYERGVYDGALVELKRAMELKPSYKALYNLGQVHLAMDDYAAGLQAFTQYLLQGGARIPKARRDAVQAELSQLAQRVAELSVQCDVSGAEVLVDDLTVGTTPLGAPVLVNAGVRRVVVQHPDFGSTSRRVSVAGGDRTVVELMLRGASENGSAPSAELAIVAAAAPTLPAPKLPAPPPVSRPAARERSSAPAWIAWGVTGALAVGALTTGLLALRADADARDKREHALLKPGELQADRTHSERLARSSDALTVAAVISGSVSLWLTLRTRREHSPTRAQASGDRLKLGVGLNRLSLQGSF